VHAQAPEGGGELTAVAAAQAVLHACSLARAAGEAAAEGLYGTQHCEQLRGLVAELCPGALQLQASPWSGGALRRTRNLRAIYIMNKYLMYAQYTRNAVQRPGQRLAREACAPSSRPGALRRVAP
jgi:hypothetical protein